MNKLKSKRYVSSFLLGLLLLAPGYSAYAQDWMDKSQYDLTNQGFAEDSQMRRPKKQRNRENVEESDNQEQKGKRQRGKNAEGHGKKGQRNSVMSDIFSNNSEIQTKITQIKEKDPRLLQSFYQGIKSQVKQFKILMQDKEQEAEIKAELEKLINKELDSLLLSISYREKPDENTKNQIKTTLEESFILKEKLHKRHIDSIKSRVGQLEEMVAKRKAHKDEIINIRLSKLTKTKDDVFSW